MPTPTKAVLYRFRSQNSTVLNQFIGTSDSDTQTNATSIAAGTGFTNAALAGQAVAYAELLNPIVYDSSTGLVKRLNNTVLYTDPAQTTPLLDRVHIAKPADETATYVHAAITMPGAAVADGILAATTLTTSPQLITTSITDPAGLVPSIVGNDTDIVGTVQITYTDLLGLTGQTLSLSLNGSTTVTATPDQIPNGVSTIQSILVPAQTADSSETIEVGTNGLITIAAITNPDVPRGVSATGSTSGITGNEILYGELIDGTFGTDSIALSGSSTVNGVRAFQKILTIYTPPQNAGGNTVSIGISDKLGLGVALSRNTVTKTYLANVLEGTAPTVVVNSTDISKNVITLNSDLDGASDVDAYLITG